MNLLLDAHALLWWSHSDSRLSARAVQAIADPGNRAFISTASLWEMSIKYAAGKLPEYAVLAQHAATILNQQGFTVLPIFYEHAFAATQLPMHHRDPFDRILIATAIMESRYIVSKDEAFRLYPVQVIW